MHQRFRRLKTLLIDSCLLEIIRSLINSRVKKKDHASDIHTFNNTFDRPKQSLGV